MLHRSNRSARFQCRCNGKLGPNHIQRDGPAVWWWNILKWKQREDCYCYCSWTCPSGMIRSPFFQFDSLNAKWFTEVLFISFKTVKFTFRHLPVSCLVVWQPCDYQVVEWPVAQWRFCILRRISWGGWSWAGMEHCECLKLMQDAKSYH